MQRPSLPRFRAPFPWGAPVTPGGVEPLKSDPTTGAHYDTDWARSPAARAARAVVVETVMRPVMAGFARPERRGLDRFADLDGPLIFAANHHSHADTPLLLTSIPRPWRHEVVVGAAADYFFGTRVTGAISALAIGAIPIERTKVGRRSADLATRLIDDGWSLLIYPEGGRSPDGWGQPFRGGAGFLARRCGVPVVPVHVWGTDRILRKGRSIPQASNTVVSFGAPILPGPDDDARTLAARIEAAVAELADEITSDWYTARLRARSGGSPGLTGPEIASWRRAWALGDRARRRRRRAQWPELS
ncbi:MAG: 1-acyl-sn-glycerol-3-phosphate acyltransferase [Acidimicrobiales bacterium]|nr:1-acyl-sn-glycerol-3-phosphate acyltransferase [Acidimicrobiales bacterium]